jgi:hypothetical protein
MVPYQGDSCGSRTAGLQPAVGLEAAGAGGPAGSVPDGWSLNETLSMVTVQLRGTLTIGGGVETVGTILRTPRRNG